MKTGRRENGDIHVGKIGAMIAAVGGLLALFGVLVSWGADKTNIVRDVLANTTGRTENAIAVKAVDRRLDTTEKDILKLKTDVVQAIGEMKTTAAKLNGKINTVQASLNTLNDHLEHMSQ